MEALTRTVTASVRSHQNIRYPTSWQGILKIGKMVFLFCCSICSALLVYRVKYSGYNYCLAVSIIGLLLEILLYISYMAGLNKKWESSNAAAVLIMIYHIIMSVLVFVAVIIMTGRGYEVGSYRNVNWNWVDHYTTMIQVSRAYNAFGIFSVIGFSLEIYFNLVWLRGGPELTSISVPTS